jgi:WD40 repeat protein
MTQISCGECGAALSAEGACIACAATAAGSLQTFTEPVGRSPAARHPDRIGPYGILGLLGEGGMGIVYLAQQDRPLRRQVALKVIKVGMDTSEVVARFDAERQALALMDHPHVAQVYDAGATDDGRPYFVMEYVAGVPITSYCDEIRLSTRARLELFLDVCAAVQHAHQKGIIHRDIKPSNVLVAHQDDRRMVKVIDFGIAKATRQRLTEKSVFTELGLLIGTPEYMSPEQAEMSGLEVDTTTDIYSLGVVLYELLVGALPFDSAMLRRGGYAEIQRIIRDVEPLAPSVRLTSLGLHATDVAQRRDTDVIRLRKQLHHDLDWITLRALEKDRGRRYQSASELAADIRRHLVGDVVTARPASAVYRARKFVARNRLAVSAAVMVVAAVVAGLGVSAVLYRRSETQRQSAERNAFISALAAADAQILASEGVSPSGASGSQLSAADEATRRLESIPRTERRWEWHYLANKLDASVATLWGGADAGPGRGALVDGRKDSPPAAVVYEGPLAMSDDGRRVFWATSDAVHSWDTTSGRMLPALPARGLVSGLSQNGSLQLSPDWRLPQPWRVIATLSGATVSTLATSSLDVQHVAFSGDGGRVVTATTQGVIQVWNSRDGTQIARTTRKSPLSFIAFAPHSGFLIAGASGELLMWRFAAEPAFVRIGDPAPRPLVAGAVNAYGRVAVTVDETGEIRTWTIQSVTGTVVDPSGTKTAVTTRLGLTSVFGQHPGAKIVTMLARRSSVVATAGDDGVVRLWDSSTRFRGDPPALLNAHDHLAIDAMLFSANGEYLVAGSRRGLVRVWDVRRARLAGLGASDTGLISSDIAAISANGRFVIMGTGVVDLQTLAQSRSPDRFTGLVGSAIADDGKTAIFGLRDGSVWLRRSGDRAMSISLGLFAEPVTDVVISGDGRVAAASSANYSSRTGHLTVWDLTEPREIASTQTAPITRLRINDARDALLVVSAPVGQGANCRGWVELRSVRTGQVTQSIPQCADDAAFSGTSGIIIHSAADHRFRVFSTGVGSLVATSDEIPRPETLAATPDGRRFAARADGRLIIFDTQSGAQLLTIPSPHRYGAPGSVNAWGARALRFSSDGHRLIEVADGRIQVRFGTSLHELAPRALLQQLLNPNGAGR